jgi:hypothetical protein
LALGVGSTEREQLIVEAAASLVAENGRWRCAALGDRSIHGAIALWPLSGLPHILAPTSASFGDARNLRRTGMLLATTTVEDFDRFTDVFSTKGAEKRKQHGSKGALVFRDPNQSDRVWVIFDWDLDGWQSFASDPEVPPILQEAGHKSRPEVPVLSGSYEA